MKRLLIACLVTVLLAGALVAPVSAQQEIDEEPDNIIESGWPPIDDAESLNACTTIPQEMLIVMPEDLEHGLVHAFEAAGVYEDPSVWTDEQLSDLASSWHANRESDNSLNHYDGCHGNIDVDCRYCKKLVLGICLWWSRWFKCGTHYSHCEDSH